MTATAPIAVEPLDPSAADAVPLSSRDNVVWLSTMAGVLGIFLLLQNQYWVPAGDSEMYTTIARNFALGKGLLFNGQPVRMIPTGWPVLLGLAMKVSSSFLFLKLFTMGCMLGALSMFYWICRRFASPMQAAAVILLTALLSHVYQATIWLISEPSFCLVSALAILLAMQINEKRPPAWRIALLLILCGAGVTIRWTGVLTWLLVAAALVNGQIRPRFDRYWVTLFFAGVVAAGTFAALRYGPAYLHRAAARNAPPVVGSTRDDAVPNDDTEDDGVVGGADSSMAQAYPLIPGAGNFLMIANRFLTWGHWFSQLLWQPLRIGGTDRLLSLPSVLIGWLVLLFLFFQIAHAFRGLHWMWPAVLAYSLALALEWNHPNARYLVPVAPLVILGVLKGLEFAASTWGGAKRSCRILTAAFVATLILCNGALWAVDVYVARSHDFYANYDAGLNMDLIAASQAMNAEPPGPWRIAVSQRYANLGRSRRWNPFGLRATTMLTGKSIVGVPDHFVRNLDPAHNGRFLIWARMVGIKYFLYQPPVSPWRVFHFRVGWYQEQRTGKPVQPTEAAWRLYRIPPTGNDAEPVELPAVEQWPTRVPGI